MKYKRIYEMLKKYGHSPLMANQIIFDASRGDKHAIKWIVHVFEYRHWRNDK
jgi:hypothetical protein